MWRHLPYFSPFRAPTIRPYWTVPFESDYIFQALSVLLNSCTIYHLIWAERTLLLPKSFPIEFKHKLLSNFLSKKPHSGFCHLSSSTFSYICLPSEFYFIIGNTKSKCFTFTPLIQAGGPLSLRTARCVQSKLQDRLDYTRKPCF